MVAVAVVDMETMILTMITTTNTEEEVPITQIIGHRIGLAGIIDIGLIAMATSMDIHMVIGSD